MTTVMPTARAASTVLLSVKVHSISISNGISDGDLMLLVVEHVGSASDPILPTGWTFLVKQAHGTRTGLIYWKFREPGDTDVRIERITEGGGRATLIAYGGVDPNPATWVIGTPRSRATSPADTSYVTSALDITTTAVDTLVVGVFGEATSAAEASGFVPTVSSNATVTAFVGQVSTGDLETILITSTRMATPGNTGKVIATYPNPQSSNGWGVLLGLPSLVTGNGQVRRLPAKMSDGQGNIIDVGLTAWDGTKEIPLSKIELVHSGTLVPDLLRTERVFTMAHRGGSADYQEHTLRGYVQSAIARVDALEFSIARTSDGVFFGAHDATLNRTTSGLPANYEPREHTWAEISKLTQDLGSRGDTRFGNDRYYTLEEFLAIWGKGSHSLFLDPKVLKLTDLVDLITRLKQVPNYRDIFVGKYFHTGTIVADEFAAAGIATWGYAYTEAITGFRPDGTATGDPLLSSTASRWTMLGLEYSASQEVWDTALAIANGKKVIAHIVNTVAQAQAGVQKGARGLQIAGISNVMAGY